jgi:hypothetical protein
MIVLFAFGLFLAISTSSCSKKTGCPMNEQMEVDLEDDRSKNNRSRSGLFPRR